MPKQVPGPLSHCISIAVAASFIATGVMAQENGTGAAPGVNPKDNITKIELLYRYDSLDLGDHTQSLTFKYDKAFNSRWGGNVDFHQELTRDFRRELTRLSGMFRFGGGGQGPTFPLRGFGFMR